MLGSLKRAKSKSKEIGGRNTPETVTIVERKMTVLHVAAARGEYQRLESLLAAGADPNLQDPDCCTPLHHAALHGHAREIKVLLRFGANINAADVEGYTPLHNAASNGHLEAIETLLKTGANIEAIDRKKGTALLNAACNGHAEAVKLLIKCGANKDAADQEGISALHYASYNGQDRVLNALLQAGATVGVRDVDGATPLHYACGRSQRGCIKLLLKAGAKPSVEDNSGVTPIHTCAFLRDEESLRLMLKSAGDLNQKDKEGATALHKAAYAGDLRVLTSLLNEGADINSTDSEGSYALHKAAFRGNVGAVQVLLERGAKVDCLDSKGGTALLNAAYSGHWKCVEVLLGNDPNRTINKADSLGRVPLHAAACYGHWEVVLLLLEKGADPNKADYKGFTPAHLAAFNGNSLCLAHLIEKGANISIGDKDKRLPLHFAASQGRLSCIHVMLNYVKNLDLDAGDFSGATAMHFAASNNHWEIISYLLRKRALVDPKSKDLLTPLHFAVKTAAINSIIELLEHGADIKARDKKGVTPNKLAKLQDAHPVVTTIFKQLPKKKPYPPGLFSRLHDLRQKDIVRKSSDKDKSVDTTSMGEPQLITNLSITSPFIKYGYEFDLNDHMEVAKAVLKKTELQKMQNTYLNVLRLLYIIPANDEMLCRKMWALIEAYVNQIVLPFKPERSKINWSEFREVTELYQDVVKSESIDKLKTLNGVENSLKILFPNLPPNDEYGDVEWSTDNFVDEEESGSRISRMETPGLSIVVANLNAQAAAAIPEERRRTNADAPRLIIGLPPNVKQNLPPGMSAALGVGTGGGAGGPPPPPPIMGGGGGGGAPPPPMMGGMPPPPMMGGGGSKKREHNFRKFNWTKIPPPQIGEAVWRAFKTDVPWPDVPSLCDYFEVKEEEKDVAAPKSAPKLKKQFLDLKRAQFICLFMSMVKMDPEDIRVAIEMCDDSNFTVDNLISFTKLVPAPDEIESLRPFKTASPEERAELGDAEKFLLAIMDIPRLKNRIQLLIFRRTSAQHIARLKLDVEKASRGVFKMKNSLKLHAILQMVLVLGNTLNAGTYAGNCKGFTLDSLLKMKDCRSPNKENYTLLHYLVSFLSENDPRVLNLSDDLDGILHGDQEHISSIGDELNILKESLAILQIELAEASREENDEYHSILRELNSQVEMDINTVADQVETIRQDQKDLQTFYAADKGLDIMSMVWRFAVEVKALRAQYKQQEAEQKTTQRNRGRTDIKSRGRTVMYNADSRDSLLINLGAMG